MSERVKLTKAQRETLDACPEWSSPLEIIMRRHNATGEIVSGIGTDLILGWLRNRGLVEFSAANNVFRQTDAGSAALSAQSDK